MNVISAEAELMPPYFSTLDVNIGRFCLTFLVKIGYNIFMTGSIITFVLRLSLIAAVWVFFWQLVQPRTQLMRIFRAALVLAALLVIMALMKITGR